MTTKENEIINSLEEKVTKIFTLLTGNGEAGLCEKIRNLENKVFKEPDNIGKWLVRITQWATLAILIYITFFKK